jgi:hypothetical protein
MECKRFAKPQRRNYIIIKDVINKAMENRQYCTAVFLVVSQAFDKVWHPGLLLKIKRLLPLKYFNLLQSYLSGRQFEIQFNGEILSRFHIHSEVPQGSILGPPSISCIHLIYQHPGELR